jgi:hypothetical protein
MGPRRGSLPGLLALLLFSAGASGCATAQKALGDEGATCQSDDDCTQGLTCKASSCTPERSRVGQVCVTDKGCVELLSCLQGRCSQGRASAEQVGAACLHLRGLMEATTQLVTAGSGEVADASQMALEMEAFAMECRERLTESGTTREKAACISQVQALEHVQACP